MLSFATLKVRVCVKKQNDACFAQRQTTRGEGPPRRSAVSLRALGKPALASTYVCIVVETKNSRGGSTLCQTGSAVSSKEEEAECAISRPDPPRCR